MGQRLPRKAGYGRRRDSSTGAEEPCFAAIDLGTHNCRMLIATGSPGGPRVVDGFSRIVRLGEGLGRSGKICDEAIGRAIAALKVCAGKIRRHNVVGARHVATEACRQAINCDEFFIRVREETGIALETIPAEEEANLTLTGCLPLLDWGTPRGLLFDIGGGSTELTWVDLERSPPKPLATTSLPIGVVSLMELKGGPDCTGDAFGRLVCEIGGLFDDFDRACGIADAVAAGRVMMLGTSGTVTTLGALHIGLERYDRSQVDGMTMDFDAIDRLVRDITRMTCDERGHLPCIGPQRADLMVMGCAILTAITRRWPAGRLRIADRGVREGLLVDMMRGSGV